MSLTGLTLVLRRLKPAGLQENTTVHGAAPILSHLTKPTMHRNSSTILPQWSLLTGPLLPKEEMLPLTYLLFLLSL